MWYRMVEVNNVYKHSRYKKKPLLVESLRVMSNVNAFATTDYTAPYVTHMDQIHLEQCEKLLENEK